jgi:hypothetical protein
MQIYLARVRGFFPNRPPALQQLQKIDLKYFDIDFDIDLDPAHDHSGAHWIRIHSSVPVYIMLL